jgi:hypothetical protein
MSKRYGQCALVLSGLLVILATIGCGSGGTANLRVLHAAPNEPQINTLIDGNTVNSNLAYSANTGYFSVSSGSRHLQVETVSSSTPIVDTTLTLADSSSTTVIVTGTATITPIVLTDATTAPTAGTAEIRLVNAAPNMAAADVYVVPTGTSIVGVSPLASGLTFGTASTYENLTITAATSANFDVYFTEPGTKLAELATSGISIASGSALTFVSMNNVGGGFTFQTLTDLQ